MTVPSWLAAALAALMVVIALASASRLALSRLRRREAESDADGVHVVMGAAMAGMFMPRLSLLPATVWEAVFGIAAAWFAWRAIRSRRGGTSASWQSRHPVPHLVECAAMLYMFLAVPGARPGGPAAGMPMPGMGGPAGAAWKLPALAMVLALFMAGYVLWSADQLTALARGQGAVAARHMLAPRLAACYKIAMSTAMGYMLVATI
jgi:Domain of unknown function (DUF5134)